MLDTDWRKKKAVPQERKPYVYIGFLDLLKPNILYSISAYW